MADQRGVAALPLHAGEMLRRGAAGLARQLGQPCLVDAMSAGGVDADRADMLEALDQAEHRQSAWPLPASGAARPASSGWFGPALRQGIQTAAAARRTARRSDGDAISRRAWWRTLRHRAFERSGRRNDNPALFGICGDQPARWTSRSFSIAGGSRAAVTRSAAGRRPKGGARADPAGRRHGAPVWSWAR